MSGAHTYILYIQTTYIVHKNLHDVANHSPLGLNFTEEIAFVCPAKVYLIT